MVQRVTVQQQQPPAFFVRGPSPLARLIFFSVVSLVLMAVDARLHYLKEVRQGFVAIMYPLEVIASSPVRMYRHISDFFSDQDQLLVQNQQLKQKLVLQSLEMQRLRSVDQENSHFRTLFEVLPRLGQTSRLAEILHTGRDPFVHKIIVNLGSQQGILPGQAVVDGLGVVGQVTRVFPFTSEVTLVTDKSLVIPVQVQRNGLRAIAFGHGRDGTLYVPYLPANVDIQQGDRLMTSGIDGIYPEGLEVASVSRIERDPESPFARIICRPSAGTDRHRQLLIVSPSQPIPEKQPVAAPLPKKASHAPRKP